MKPSPRCSSAAAAKGIAIQIVRVGSRGMVWLEPLVEVEVAGERIGYGPVEAATVASLVVRRAAARAPRMRCAWVWSTNCHSLRGRSG